MRILKHAISSANYTSNEIKSKISRIGCTYMHSFPLSHSRRYGSWIGEIIRAKCGQMSSGFGNLFIIYFIL